MNITFPNTVLDLHLVDRFCREQNWDVTYVTDITSEKFPDGVSNVIVGGQVDVNSLVFYKKNKNHFRYADNRKKFISTIISEMKNIMESSTTGGATGKSSLDKKLFIYYTGHGSGSTDGNTSILLPNGDSVSFNEFRDLITNNFYKDGEILCVLDCCHPSSMNLAYNFISDFPIKGVEVTDLKNRPIHKTGKWRLNNDYIPCKQKFMLIASASVNQVSAANKYQSFFTKSFFNYLSLLNKKLEEAPYSYKWPNRNLIAICKRIAEDIENDSKIKQCTSIYSSYKELPIIPLWVGAFNMDVTISIKAKLITINNKTEDSTEGK